MAANKKGEYKPKCGFEVIIGVKNGSLPFVALLAQCHGVGPRAISARLGEYDSSAATP